MKRTSKQLLKSIRNFFNCISTKLKVIPPPTLYDLRKEIRQPLFPDLIIPDTTDNEALIKNYIDRMLNPPDAASQEELLKSLSYYMQSLYFIPHSQAATLVLMHLIVTPEKLLPKYITLETCKDHLHNILRFANRKLINNYFDPIAYSKNQARIQMICLNFIINLAGNDYFSNGAPISKELKQLATDHLLAIYNASPHFNNTIVNESTGRIMAALNDKTSTPLLPKHFSPPNK